MPKPQFVKYTNGKTALDFKKNGTGIAYYPSGKVAVAVTSPHGGSGRYYNFYLDVTNNGDGDSKASQMLIASFNNEGVGLRIARSASQIKVMLIHKHICVYL